MDILESLSSLQIICQLSNLTQWQYVRSFQMLRRSYLLEIYTWLVLISSGALLLYGLFGNDKNIIKYDNTDIGDTVDFIQLVGIRISHIVCLGETLVQRQVQRQFFEKVRQIDKIFECSLNVDVNNRKFRRKTLQRASIMLAVYIISELLILATKLINTPDHGFPLYWIFYFMPLLVCGLRYFQIYTAINIIKRRFDKLIQVLTSLNMKTTQSSSATLTFENSITAAATASTAPVPVPAPAPAQAPTGVLVTNHGEPTPLKTLAPMYNYTTNALLHLPTLRKGAFFRQSDYNVVVAQTELYRLLVVRDLYNQLWELTALLNRSFGISILINVGNDFISITSNCYWTFLNFKEFAAIPKYILHIACSVVWSVPHLFNIIALAIICERTQHCTTRMALSLHRINIDIENDNHNSVIEQFSLQLLHQKLTFTAAGFFNVDCTLLYTIVGATTTYLIILIQFHMNETTAGGGGGNNC